MPSFPDNDPYLVPKSPVDKVHTIAQQAGIAPDVADDFLKVTGGIESGNRHYDRSGRVKRSPAGALGFSQVLPGTAAKYGLNPYDESQNIEAGLRYFSEGGNDPVRRRIAYLSGHNSRAVKQYDRTGQIPAGGDKYTGVSFKQYVAASKGQQSPQNPYLVPATPQKPKSYDTTLTPTEEQSFQQWKAKYAPNDTGADYDLRGAFKAGLTPDPKTGHWPDTFKKPNHPTFSNESQYAVGADAAKAGRWQGERFIKPETDPYLVSSVPAQPKGWGVGRIGQGVRNVRVGPRGFAAASVEGEAKPSEATVARGALRNIAGQAGLPTQIPTEAGDFINQMVAEGTAGLMERGAGLTRIIPHDPFAGQNQVTDIAANRINAGAQQIRQASQAIDKDTERAGVNVPVVGRVTTKDVQNVGSGAIASAAPLLLTRLGIPAPLAFGLDQYLASTGRGEEFKKVLQETGLATATGGLYEIPLPQAAKTTLLRNIGAKLGLGAIGGYGLAKAFGVPEEEARKNAAITALFMGSGAKKEPSALSQGLDRLIAQEGARQAREITPETSVRPGIRPAPEEIIQPPQPATPEPQKPAQIPPSEAATTPTGATTAAPPKTILPGTTIALEDLSTTELQRRVQKASPHVKAYQAELDRRLGAQPVRPETTPPSPETKTPKLALGVEAKAVEAKLTKGFEDLPEYQTVNVADQAARATDLLKTNPEQAKRIAMGQETPPEGLLPESVFTAVENHALKNKDVETIRDLATASTLPTEATGMGQRIRMLAERNPSSAVSAIRDIQMAREAKAQKTFGKNGADKIKTEIQVEVRRAAPKAKDWAAFLEEIKCR